MTKVLFAINHPAAEKKLSELISANEEYKVVGTMVSQMSIIDYLKKNTADVLVYREGLTGDEDDFDFIINLRLSYPTMRVVFIAGDREPGDKRIPMLITYAVYDILAGTRIMVQDMARLVMNPSSLQDVRKWLPGKIIKNGIFDDEDLEGLDGESNEPATPKETVEVENLPEEPKNQPIQVEPAAPIPKQEAPIPKKSFGMSLKDRLTKQSQKPVEQATVQTTDLSSNETKEEPNVLNYKPLSASLNKPADDKSELEEDSKLIGNIPSSRNPFKKSKDDDDGHMPTPLATNVNVKEVKVPSRAAIEDAEKLAEAQKEITELKRKLRDSERKAEKTNDELAKTLNEYLNLEKQVSSNSKQRVVMFYGAMAGVGNSTIALNVATYLAKQRYKVIYVELNNVTPTLSYWYDLSEITVGIEKALMGIEARAYQEVNKNIVTKQMILDLNSDMKETAHEKYPDLLHYMFFSDSYVKQGDPAKIAPTTLKDLLMLLLYKEGYDYIILDVYPHHDYHIVETAAMFSTTNVFTMTQDVVTVGASLRKFASLEASGLDFEMLKESEHNKKNSIEPVQNFKNFYVINKFENNATFNKKKISEWLEADKKIFYVPNNATEIYNNIYKALPAIQDSKNKEFKNQIARIAESI